MMETKELVDSGVSLSMDFNAVADDLFGRCELILYRKFGARARPYVVVDANLRVNESYADFEPAYAFFKAHLDPLFNPGAAFRKATEEVAERGGEANESQVLREVFDLIRSKGWAMQYRKPDGAAPRQREKYAPGVAGLTAKDREAFMKCPKRKWFRLEDLPKDIKDFDKRLAHLTIAGVLEEKTKDSGEPVYRVKK